MGPTMTMVQYRREDDEQGCGGAKENNATPSQTTMPILEGVLRHSTTCATCANAPWRTSSRHTPWHDPHRLETCTISSVEHTPFVMVNTSFFVGLGYSLESLAASTIAPILGTLDAVVSVFQGTCVPSLYWVGLAIAPVLEGKYGAYGFRWDGPGNQNPFHQCVVPILEPEVGLTALAAPKSPTG